jgi:hypothetical protein
MFLSIASIVETESFCCCEQGHFSATLWHVLLWCHSNSWMLWLMSCFVSWIFCIKHVVMGQKLITFAGVLSSSFYQILLFCTALTNIFLSLSFLSLSLMRRMCGAGTRNTRAWPIVDAARALLASVRHGKDVGVVLCCTLLLWSKSRGRYKERRVSKHAWIERVGVASGR